MPTPKRPFSLRVEPAALLVTFLVALGVLHLTLRDFFPTALGTLGHDWTLSWLLQLNERYRNEGLSLWTIWFTPAACHSTVYVGPGFPLNPSAWFVLAGLTPLAAVYLEALCFFAAGFFGMVRLLGRSFDCDHRVALAGAVLFMLNQFSISRALIGHQYYPFLLLPWMCLLLLPPPGTRFALHDEARAGVALAALAAYSWFVGVMPIVAWVALVLVMMAAFWSARGGDWRIPATRGAVAALAVVPLAAYTLYQQFGPDAAGLQTALSHRQAYPLQGFVSLTAALGFLAKAMFVSPPDIQLAYDLNIVNLAIVQQRHELEFGITFVPLLMLAVGLAVALRRASPAALRAALAPSRLPWLALLLAALVLPLLYTVYEPGLNAFFKRLPVFNSTTSPQRIYLVYPFFILVFACVVFSRFAPPRLLWPGLVVAVGVAAAFNLSVNRDFYRFQPYQVGPVQNAARQIQAGARLPPITTIAHLKMADGRAIQDRPFEANAFLDGIQSMGCYMRGYGNVPETYVKSLEPGPALAERNGFLNLKNPACNAFPAANGCAPGDHFRADQREWAERYLSYRSFPVRISTGQSVANLISWLAWGGCLVLAIATLRRRLGRHRCDTAARVPAGAGDQDHNR